MENGCFKFSFNSLTKKKAVNTVCVGVFLYGFAVRTLGFFLIFFFEKPTVKINFCLVMSHRAHLQTQKPSFYSMNNMCLVAITSITKVHCEFWGSSVRTDSVVLQR